MALIVLGLSMYMAREHMGFTGAGRWFWATELGLIVAILLVRRTLKWRYPY
ncbi:FtsH-binding integral membrane protein [Bradyrhizobium sp. USDA 4369]